MFEREERGSRLTQELLRILAGCKMVEYRKAALQSLALSKHTLPFILKKVRDVREEVRCAVFEKLIAGKEKSSLDQLRVEDRAELIYNGLTDRNKLVQEACQKYLQSWMLSKVEPKDRSEPREGRAIQLLSLFAVEKLKNDEERCACLPLLVGYIAGKLYQAKDLLAYYKTTIKTKLMSILEYKSVGAPDHPMGSEIPLSQPSRTLRHRPSSEALLLLRMSCEYWAESRERFGDILHQVGDILPDAKSMQEIICAFIADSDTYAAHELLLLLPFYNHAEAAVGQQLSLTLDDILTDVSLEDYRNVSEAVVLAKHSLAEDQLDMQRRDVVVRRRADLVAVALRVLKQIMSDKDSSSKFKEKVKTYISNLMEEIKDLQNKQEMLEKEKNPENRQRVEQEIGKLSQHASLCLMHALRLAVGLLQTCKIDKTDLLFLKLCQDTLVKPAFESHEIAEFLATQYLALYAIVDVEKCAELMVFFREQMKDAASSQTFKSIVAVKSMFDFYAIHGPRTEEFFASSAGRSESLSQELLMLLYAPSTRLRFLVYEGFVKLMFREKLPRAEIHLVPLILFLGDPNEEDGGERANPIRQVLTLAFNRYTKLVPSGWKKLSRAVVLTTLVWISAKANESRIGENTLLRRFLQFDYGSAIAQVMYRLTHAFIGTEGGVSLEQSLENPLAQIVIMLLHELSANGNAISSIKTALDVCLKYIDLDRIKPEVMLALYMDWKAFMAKSEKECEYCALESQLKLGILKLTGKSKDQGEEEVKETELREAKEFFKEASEAVTKKLHRKHEKLQAYSQEMTKFYSQLCLDPAKGCYRNEKLDLSAAAAPATERMSFMEPFGGLLRKKKLKSACVSDLAMDTPKSTNVLASKKRKRGKATKGECLEPSGKVRDPSK